MSETIDSPKTGVCTVCGAALSAAAGGLCPRCLLAEAAEPTHAPGSGPRGEAPPSPAEVIAAFPQFEIVDLIGIGGMGTVWRARQPKLNRYVALKLLPASLAERDPAFAERFEREGQLLARLHHPNIVTVHDSGRAGNFFYLVMEFVDGVNLRQAMRASRFTSAQALAVVPRICEALQYAHEEGVLHRDIKPENILLDSKGRVKLADFGIAKLVAQPEAGPAGAASSRASGGGSLTLGDATLGTPDYMAPEQIDRPSDVDHRADIYSLGVVFYELLTGELPKGAFAAPSARAATDPRLDRVVRQALEKERERRQQSAGEMRTQMETIAAGGSGVASAAKRWRSIVKRKPVIAAAIILVILTVWLLIPFGRERRARNREKAVLSFRDDSPEIMRIVEEDFPKEAHIPGRDGSLLVVHDHENVHYIFYYAGDFSTSSSSSQNTHSLAWRDEGRITLEGGRTIAHDLLERLEGDGSITFAGGRTFGYHRKSVNPFALQVNGKEYDLRNGRILQLRDDGTVEQWKVFPPLLSATNVDAVAKMIASAREMTEAPTTLAKLRHQRDAAEAQLADLLKTHAPDHPVVVSVRREIEQLRHRIDAMAQGTTGQVGRMAVPDAATASFTPVDVCVVKGAIDFDSGKNADLPEAVAQKADITEAVRAATAWMEAEGYDALADSRGHFYGVGLRCVAQHPSAWEQLTAPEIVTLLDSAIPERAPYANLEPLDPAAAYLFQTREGGKGILQILGVTGEQSVKIRYKLVQTREEARGPAEEPITLAELHDQLDAAKAQLADRSKIYLPGHRLVVSVRREIEELQQKIEAMEQGTTGQSREDARKPAEQPSP